MPASERPPAGRWLRPAGALVALLLVIGVLALAGPTAVARRLADTDLGWLGLAAAAFVATTAVRGLRLMILARRPGPLIATAVAAAAQAAAQLIPVRAGELALPLLLRRNAGIDLSRGAGVLLAARTLDLAALGAWAAAAILAVTGLAHPVALAGAALLVVPALLLPILLGLSDRLATRALAHRGVRWRRQVRRLRRLRRSLDELRRSPERLGAAVLASLLMWAGVWLYTWLLLAALDYQWALPTVVAGSAAAAAANLVPFNLLGNLGTLEAGWTAAFTALGVPLADAAASGLAAHLWALFLTAATGGLAGAVLALHRPPPGKE